MRKIKEKTYTALLCDNFFHTLKYIAPLNQTSTTTLTNDSNSHADWSKEKVGRQKRGGEDPVVNLNNDSLVIFSFCLQLSSYSL